MVQVIERKEDAKGAPYIEFHVHQTGLPLVVRGQIRFERFGPGAGQMSVVGNSMAGVAEAWAQALALAQRADVPFILVVDPYGLFPPGKRP